MEFYLTEKERSELKVLHKREKERRVADRIKCILLLDANWSYKDIAEALLLDDSTVRAWSERYRWGGLDALILDDYQGSACKLSYKQEVELKQYLSEHTYLYAKEIIVYVQEQYGLKYSVSGMHHLLERLGFVYKKPKLEPGKADLWKQKVFLKEYFELRKQMGEQDKLYFTDASHPQHNTLLSYGWILKGTDKIIKSNTGRERLNLNGALEVQDQSVVIHNEETVNGESMVKLFKELERINPEARVIHVVLDNAKYNRSLVVKEYVLGSRIQLHYLPTYSPNLNLIERLWKFFHKKVLYNMYYESYAKFKERCMGFFSNIQEHQAELKSLLTENFQLLGT